MFDVKFDKIYWILGDLNATPQKLKQQVEFLPQMPDDFSNETGRPQLYVLDDSMFEAQSKSIANLLTKGCHHQNISVIFLTQNIFHQGKYSRDISLNFTHLCIMKNPRDRSQFQFLARQIFPECPRALLMVYKQISEQPYGYLFIDLTQKTHELLRFRTDIFNPSYLTVYCPNTMPKEINEEPVEHTMCDDGTSISACLKKSEI